MKQNFNMPFTESGITLHFPDSNYFCFENCEGYQKLSAYHFKEMDAGWFDVNNNIFYLVELKDFTETRLNIGTKEGKDSVSSKIWGLVKKSVDSCVMLSMALIGTDTGKEILTCLPKKSFDLKQVKLIHIIKINDNQKGSMIFIKDGFNERFKAYKDLFGLKDCSVMTYEQAKRHLSNFVK